MLVGLPARRINLQYMLHKIRRAKTSSYRKCVAEKETSVHILYNVLLEKIRMLTLDFARMDLEQITEVRVSGIVTFGKGTGLLNSPYKFK